VATERLGPSAASASAALVRRLGAFERMEHCYQQRYTMHFCMVAELAEDLDPASLDAGLLAVQHRHPLLNVYVGDDPQAGLGLYRPAAVPPIPVTVIDTKAGRTWADIVAEELTHPFDRSMAPLARAVLVRAGQSIPAAITLTFDHDIADGLSASFVLRDLFAALNGHDLQALAIPPSQEELLAPLRVTQPDIARAATGQPKPEQPPWLATPSTLRPFDGAVPYVSAVAFDEELTRRLITRAHAEQTTVHSALVSAMSRVLIESGRNEFVRMLTAFEFRRRIGVGDDVCLYFHGTRTAFTRDQLTDLWNMARTVSAELAQLCSLPALLAVSAATEQLIPIDATSRDAENFMIEGLSGEAFASNLRILDMGPPESVRPLTIWGPAILLQFQGERTTGICTFNGQLRIVSVSRDPFPDYLDRVRDVLDSAC
jgi:hypothetical protein